jgi:ferredoxin
MIQHREVYEKLATHLDRLPAGFPKTESGVELRILRRLFSPEEASLAQLLTLKPEPAESLAARSGLDPAVLGPKLEEMSRKGLIFRLRKGPETRYMAAQFVVGIWEYHVNDLDPQLIRDMNEYIPHFFTRSYLQGTPQLRTIPVPGAVHAGQAIMPYEQARHIITAQDKIVVAPCICRKEHTMAGHGCDRPLESCLVFGPGAVYYEENGIGRPIDQEEALAILDRAEDSGLVLQPSNAQKVVNICTCCGCCCQILKNLKNLPAPARLAASNYRATVDAPLCSGCETCLERCQMEAIRMESQVAVVDLDRCIGCGLCVPACPVEAIALELKPENERQAPPASLMETYQRIARERMERLHLAEIQ